MEMRLWVMNDGTWLWLRGRGVHTWGDTKMERRYVIRRRVHTNHFLAAFQNDMLPRESQEMNHASQVRRKWYDGTRIAFVSLPYFEPRYKKGPFDAEDSWNSYDVQLRFYQGQLVASRSSGLRIKASRILNLIPLLFLRALFFPISFIK
jgi:hypothetical protein